MNENITLSVAAKRLGLNPSTLRRWVREGRIPAYRSGVKFVRVSWEEILASLARSRPEAVRDADETAETRPSEAAEDSSPGVGFES